MLLIWGAFKRYNQVSIISAKDFIAELTLNPPEGIIAGPISEDNFFEWECLITGPDDSCFENGVFPAKITFPQVVIDII